jgi:valyl-tRNA synthetase
MTDLALEDRWILSRLAHTMETMQQQLEAYNPSAAISSTREFFWGDLCDWYLEIIKPRMRREADAPLARQVLAYALDQVLRLLHPFVPFVTESLWEKLNQRAPQRGITTELPAAPLLMRASWPQVITQVMDRALEEKFAVLQETVRAMRDLRSRFHVPPARRLAARVRATGPVAVSMEQSQDMLCSLAGLESLEISEIVVRQADAATALVHDVEIHLGGIVDPTQEKARITKQRGHLAKEMEASRRKLENEQFVGRAKPEAVAKERSKAADLERQIASLDESLRALG